MIYVKHVRDLQLPRDPETGGLTPAHLPHWVLDDGVTPYVESNSGAGFVTELMANSDHLMALLTILNPLPFAGGMGYELFQWSFMVMEPSPPDTKPVTRSVKWDDLSVKDQLWLLRHFYNHWVNVNEYVPGDINVSENKPLTAYKIASYGHKGIMRSLFEPSIHYIIGESHYEAAKHGHKGGFYAYQDRLGMLTAWHEGNLIPPSYCRYPPRIAVLEVQVWGQLIPYAGNKIAASYLRPTCVIEVLDNKWALQTYSTTTSWLNNSSANITVRRV